MAIDFVSTLQRILSLHPLTSRLGTGQPLEAAGNDDWGTDKHKTGPPLMYVQRLPAAINRVLPLTNGYLLSSEGGVAMLLLK
jgi:hypothetical protein